MLEEGPTWMFTSKRPLTRWYEHVRLLPNRVVGQWFCLDRSSGTRLWERRLERPDEIVGIDSGVIVANERWRLSFGSARRGCYGISLDEGRLLWTSHASGFGGRVLRLLDFVPGYPNISVRDCPRYVLNGKCYCRSGRVLDVQTGALLERLPPDSLVEPKQKESETQVLGRSKSLDDPVNLKAGDGLWLSHKLETKQEYDQDELFNSVWEFRLFLTDDSGHVLWEFDIKDTGYEMRYCPYEEKCRCALPYLYLLACEQRGTKMSGNVEVYDSSQFHLLTLDLGSRSLVQDIQIATHPVDSCRFEDIDQQGVLVSEGQCRLHYFSKLQAGEHCTTERK